MNLYYGSELGQTGGADPENRAPMRWDLADDTNPVLGWYRKLLDLRKRHRSLRVGDLRWLVTDRLLGFQRHTDRIAEAVFVLANPADHPVRETVLLPDSKLMDLAGLIDLLTGQRYQNYRATLDLELPTHGVAILACEPIPTHGYTPIEDRKSVV